MAQPSYASYIAEIRSRYSEPDPLGRWSDVAILLHLNRARQQVFLDSKAPEATLSGYTVNGQQEYALPDSGVTKILRVYLAGTPIPPTTINALEGNQLGIYDQSGTLNTTAWRTELKAPYPITGSTDFGAPVSLNVPWRSGARPKYYRRGTGVIGFVPLPGNSVLMEIDILLAAQPLSAQNPYDVVPDVMVDAIVWKSMFYMAAADKRDQDMASYAMEYGGQNGTSAALGKILNWNREFVQLKSRAPLFTTSRTRFSGPPRYGSGTGRLGS